MGRQTYMVTDWPLGEGETDDGSYPNVSIFTDREAALRTASELLADYAESKATTEHAMGQAPELREYIDAAVELGGWSRGSTAAWELSTPREMVELAVSVSGL